MKEMAYRQCGYKLHVYALTKAHTRHRMIKTRSQFTGDRVFSAGRFFVLVFIFLCNTGDLMVQRGPFFKRFHVYFTLMLGNIFSKENL
jgi:hypothetical protein